MMTIDLSEICFYHIRARRISVIGERNLSSAELDCYYGCNGRETCSGINLHRDSEGDPRYCAGFINVADAASGNCFHKIKVIAMERRKHNLNKLEDNCMRCEKFSENNHNSCYLNITEVLEYDRLFHTRSLRSDNFDFGLFISPSKPPHSP